MLRGNRKGVIEDFSRGIVRCVFVKKNGKLREMWATRHNGIIQRYGHEPVEFYRAELSALEKRFKNYVHVYDIQEDDVRIVNVNTLVEGEWDCYGKDEYVDIPKVEKREDMKKKKSGVIRNKEQVKDKINARNRDRLSGKERADVQEKRLEEDLDGVGNVEDLF